MPIIVIMLSFVVIAFPLNAQLAWKRLPFSLDYPRIDFQAHALNDHEIIVIGGHTGRGQISITTSDSVLKSCEILDVNKQIIIRRAYMNVARGEFVSLVDKDSNIIVISGLGDAKTQINTTVCESYNPTTNTWKIIGNLLLGRRQHTATFINNDEILVAGGRNRTTTYNAAEIFNIRTGVSRAVADYPVLINNAHSGIASNGGILFFGGREGGTGSKQTPIVHKYDTLLNRWIPSGSLPSATQYATTLVLDNKRLVISGGQIETTREYIKEIAVETNGLFQLLALMNTGRLGHGLIQWSKDSLLIVGGLDSQNKGLSTCEWVHISSGSVTPAPIIPEPRSLLQIIPLPYYTCSSNQKLTRAVAISGKGVDNNMTNTIDILEPFLPNEIQTYISSDTTLCEGKQVQLYASGGDSYEWSPPDGLDCTSCPSPIASPKTTTTYTVIIRNSFGCETQRNVSVTVTPALGNPNSLHVISPLFDGNFSFGQIPVGAIHCQWLHFKNSSDNSIILNSLPLQNNTIFSVPQHQFPLTIKANSIDSIMLCAATNTIGYLQDTADITLPNYCNHLTVPLIVQGIDNIMSGESKCDVTVSSVPYPFPMVTVYSPYPQPASETLNLDIKIHADDIPVLRAELLDNMGNIVAIGHFTEKQRQHNLTTGSMEFKTTTITSGLYIIRIRRGNYFAMQSAIIWR